MVYDIILYYNTMLYHTMSYISYYYNTTVLQLPTVFNRVTCCTGL